jgi:cytochrome c5
MVERPGVGDILDWNPKVRGGSSVLTDIAQTDEEDIYFVSG